MRKKKLSLLLFKKILNPCEENDDNRNDNNNNPSYKL